WANDYLLVQHLQETSGTHEDSTNNNNDFINSGSTQNSTGKIDGANDFSGAGVNLEDADGGNYINGLTAFTLSTWIQSDVIGTDKGFIYTKTPDGSDNVFTIPVLRLCTGTQLVLLMARIICVSNPIMVPIMLLTMW
ncbi:MAG: hypothetical protein U1C97_01295, partial [Candidatus Gracilibacteria bacterium]|nr:hypothetical protein [Candidatus Gracilibacteria bacterium]